MKSYVNFMHEQFNHKILIGMNMNHFVFSETGEILHILDIIMRIEEHICWGLLSNHWEYTFKNSDITKRVQRPSLMLNRGIVIDPLEDINDKFDNLSSLLSPIVTDMLDINTASNRRYMYDGDTGTLELLKENDIR